jgi:hypothetical protein
MNRTGLLIGALVVVVLIAWISGVFESDFSTVDVPEWDFDRSEVDQISLQSALDTVVFSRQSGRWRINRPVEADIDSVRLSSLLDNLEDLRIGSVVTRNRDRHSRYGVDSAAASIRVHSGTDTRTLVVGNTGADYRTIYVRLDDDDRVFSGDGRVSVDAATDNWRDRTIISVPVAAVVRAQIDVADDTYAASRESGTWLVEHGQGFTNADSSAVDRWLRRFAPLKGNSFSTEEAFAGASPLAVISFETVGGSSQGVEIRDTGTGLLARRPGTNDVLTLSSGISSALVPDVDTLREDS